MKFGTHNFYFGDPLTFPVAPSSAQNLNHTNTLVYDQMHVLTFLSASNVLCILCCNYQMLAFAKYSLTELLAWLYT